MSKYSGRSQASNLSGLLSNISGTIGEMGKPGEQYVDTFRRSMAPKTDVNDAESLLDYSDWARRNGYDEEATRYLEMGQKRRKEQSQANVLADAYGKSGPAKSLATAGDTRALQLNLESLQKDMEKARELGDPGLIASIGQQMQAISAEMPTAVSVKAKKGAAAIDKYQEMIDSGKYKGAELENLQKALDYLESDPDVMSARIAMEKEGLSVRQARATVEKSENDVANIETENAILDYRLQSAEMKLYEDQYALQDKMDGAAGKEAAKALTIHEVYDPSYLPEDLSANERAHAVTALKKEADAVKQASELDRGTLTDFNYARAKQLAESNPVFRGLLAEYDRINGMPEDQVNKFAARDITKRLVGRLNAYEATALANLGDKTHKAAGQLAALREMEDKSGLLEGSTYKEMLDDQALFNEMSAGLAEYMLNNGIESFNSYTEMYDAMDAVAPTLTSQDYWKKVTNQNERKRDQAQSDLDAMVAGIRKEWVAEHSAQVVKADSAWAKEPELLKEKSEEVYQEYWDNLNGFFNPKPSKLANGGARLRAGANATQFKTPQARMYELNSAEWQAVERLLPAETVREIVVRIEQGIPVRIEDWDWGKDGS
jgi:hypothetical protein